MIASLCTHWCQSINFSAFRNFALFILLYLSQAWRKWIFFPIFLTSPVTDIFPVLSNLSSHGPGKNVKLPQRSVERDFSWSIQHGFMLNWPTSTGYNSFMPGKICTLKHSAPQILLDGIKILFCYRNKFPGLFQDSDWFFQGAKLQIPRFQC